MLMLKPLPFPRPRSSVPPRPQRLPRGKKVTIAAAFICSDGVVMCADTQETIPGYTKVDVTKIRVNKTNGYALLITGAGDSHLIETAGQAIEKAFEDEFDPASFVS